MVLMGNEISRWLDMLWCQVDRHAEKRLSCLTDLFNAVPDAKVQYTILLETLGYAKKAGLAGLLAPVVKVGMPAKRCAPLYFDKEMMLVSRAPLMFLTGPQICVAWLG